MPQTCHACEPPKEDAPSLLLGQLQTEFREPLPHFLLDVIHILSELETHHEVSSPGELHPEALVEPYVNVSAHTAPTMEPCRTPICQCANRFGARREIRAIQCAARRLWRRSFLYFRDAQRVSARSSWRIDGYIAER